MAANSVAIRQIASPHAGDESRAVAGVALVRLAECAPECCLLDADPRQVPGKRNRRADGSADPAPPRETEAEHDHQVAEVGRVADPAVRPRGVDGLTGFDRDLAAEVATEAPDGRDTQDDAARE